MIGKWIQDEVARDDEILIVGSEFIMQQIEQVLDEAVAVIHALREPLASVSIESVDLARTVRAQRKSTHMQNQMQGTVVIYDAVREMLRHTYGEDGVIQAPSCANPSKHDMSSILQWLEHDEEGTHVAQEWAIAAARQLVRNPDQELCFRTRQTDHTVVHHVTDQDQVRAGGSVASEELTEDERRLQELKVATPNKETDKQRGQPGSLVCQHVTDLEQEKVGIEDSLAQVAGAIERKMRQTSDKQNSSTSLRTPRQEDAEWSRLEEAYYQVVASRPGLAVFMRGLHLADLLRLTLPGQWKGDKKAKYFQFPDQLLEEY